MTTRLRQLELLEELATAQGRLARAMLLALEDSSGDQPNVQRDAAKTGPRTAYQSGRTMDHVQRLYSGARTANERERVRRVAERLAEGGHLTDAEVKQLGEDP